MKYLLAVHIMSVIAWMAGLFYLPRLFVYHAMTDKPEVKSQLSIMEFKLYYYITTPAAVMTVLTGFGLMYFYFQHSPHHVVWLALKLLLVAGLLLHHVLCGVYTKCFEQGKNRHSHRFYRWFNEVPTLLMIFIVLLVVVQPF